MNSRCFNCLDCPSSALESRTLFPRASCIRQACVLVSVLHEKSFSSVSHGLGGQCTGTGPCKLVSATHCSVGPLWSYTLHTLTVSETLFVRDLSSEDFMWAAEGTSPCILEVCTDERPYGPVRVQAPYLTRSEDGQGRGRTSRRSTRRSSGTQHFTLDDDESVPELWGSRPDRLYEVRPLERVQRRTVQQIVNFAPLPTLEDPAPQMVDQLVDVLQQFDFQVPEQVIEVPKIPWV